MAADPGTGGSVQVTAATRILRRVAVAVVTDSTADLPAGSADGLAVRVVPLHVVVGGQDRRDGDGFGPADLAAALAERITVTTSRPTTDEFVTAYRQLLDAGADAVVSVHLSKDLSGTWQTAVLAARAIGGGLVRVVDSRSTAMGLGFAVLAGARVAAKGATAAEVEMAAVDTAAATTMLFSVDTLEYLRRGGRIGSAAALLGTALSVKPLLHVANGQIVPLEKVRTSARALARLEDRAVAVAAARPVRVAVHHLRAPQRAQDLAERLSRRLLSGSECLVSELGAVVGAHTGPGTLGVVIAPDTCAGVSLR